MATKTYSQLPKTNVLQDSDLVAIERNGIATLAINALDLKNALRNDLLQNTQSPSTHNIVLMECEHNNGIPINYPQTLVYLDGSTKYRSDPNQNYGKFIDSVKDKPFYRTLYNIPADNSSFSVKDARNYSFRSAGSLINIGVKQEDGIQKLDLLNKGKVDLDFTLQATGSANSVGALSQIYNNGSNILSSSTTVGQQGVFPSVVSLNSIKTLTMDFEKIIIDKNPLLRQNDNETTIKSIGVFAFLDISLGSVGVVVNASGGISLPINISDVINLQDELDSKADITSLSGYATTTALDTGLSGKANALHNHLISEINGLQLALDGKSATIHNHLIGDLKFDSTTSLESWLALTYAPISHTHNISAITGLQNALDSKADTTALDGYLKKDGSVLLNNTYIPSDNYSIATKVYVDNSAPNLSNYLEKGGTYNFDAGTPALILTDTANSGTTTLLGKGFNVNRNTRTLEIDEATIIFKDGTPEFQKFSINSFNANFTYKATSTSPNYIWKMDNRQIEDDILTTALVDNSIILKKDLNTYLNKMEAFGIKYTKSGLSTGIASNATALTNLCNIIKVSPTIVSWGRNRYGEDMTPISLIDITNGWKLPVVDGLANYSINISVRITGALSGGAGTPREFIVYLRRISDNSIVSNGGIIKINDNNFNGRSTNITTFIRGATDPFIATGFYLDIFNNSGSTLTLSQLEIYFDRD